MKSQLRNLILLFFITALAVNFLGCKDKTTDPETVTPITEDLFPIIEGRQIVFNGFLRDATTDTNITAFAHYSAKWTVVSNSVPVPPPNSGTSNLVLDSTLVPTGQPNPPVVWVETPFLIRRVPPTGTANFSFLQNIAPFYRKFGISNTDTLRWINLAQLDKGLNNEFTAFDSSWTTSTGNVRLLIVGRFPGKENITVNGNAFNTYKLETHRRVYVDGVKVQESATASLWLVPDIGPVKMIINADGENPGHYREFVSKNF